MPATSRALSNPAAVERRASILRYLASNGGVVQAKLPQLVEALGIPRDTLGHHLRYLEKIGAIWVARSAAKAEGRLPNRYQQRWSEQKYRDWNTARDEQKQAEFLEAQRRAALNRARPRRPPAPAAPAAVPLEPEELAPTPTYEISAALLEERIAEGLTLPDEELSKWGAW